MMLSQQGFDIKHIDDYGKLVKQYTDNPTDRVWHFIVLREHFGVTPDSCLSADRFGPGDAICISNRGDQYNPTGLGHWILLNHYNRVTDCYTISDPFGRLDYKTGIYIDEAGAGHNNIVKACDLVNRWQKGQVIWFD